MCSTNFSQSLHLLSQLGVTANYVGYHVTAYAIMLSVEDPEKLQLVSKWLYPDVAKHFNTSSICVEKNIRTVCSLVWKRNPSLLCQIAECELIKKPTNAEFLAIIATRLSHGF